MSGPAVRRTRCPQHAWQAWESQAAATAGGPAWHLASACGNVAPARNTGLGYAQRPLGTWPAWDMPGPGALGTRGAGKAAAGDRLSRAPPLQRRRPRLRRGPPTSARRSCDPSTGKTSRRRQHQQRKKAACRTRVTRGGPAWTARRPRRPFSALQTSPEPLDPLWGSGRGWQRAPRATPASGSVAWSLGGRSLQPLPPPPPLEGVAVRITRARQVRVASPAPGGGWGSVAGLWPQVVFLPRNPHCPPDRLAVALKDRAAKARTFVDRPWPETCVTPTPSRLADARPARPCASRPEPRAAATRPSAGGAP